MVKSPSKEMYKGFLADSLFSGQMNSSKVLSFKEKAPAPPAGTTGPHRALYSSQRSQPQRCTTRHIPSQPHKSLDLPGFLDDYYLNLVDWSKDDILAVALGIHLHLWNAATGLVTHLTSSKDESNPITSVSFSKEVLPPLCDSQPTGMLPRCG